MLNKQSKSNKNIEHKIKNNFKIKYFNNMSNNNTVIQYSVKLMLLRSLQESECAQCFVNVIVYE